MERQRKRKLLSLIFAVIAVVALSVAYALTSKTLSITGGSSMQRADWNIHFENLTAASVKGKAYETSVATISNDGLSINNINVKLFQPGDSAEYTVNITNDGEVNGEIQGFVLPTLTAAQQKIFDIKAVYRDDNKELTVGDVLLANTTREVTIIVAFKDITNKNDLPSTAQNINFSYSVQYVQTDKTTEDHNGVAYGSTLEPTRTIVDQIDISKDDDESLIANVYSDQTVTILGAGEAKSDVSNILVFDNMYLISVYKRSLEYMGYDTSNITDLASLYDFFETVDEDDATEVEDFLQYIIYRDCLEEMGYTDLETIVDYDTFIEYLQDNGLMDENYEYTSEGEQLESLYEAKYESLGTETYNAKGVTLTEGITNVPTGLYTGNETVTRVTLPSTVTKIEDDAFYGCTELTYISIPDSVTSIGYRAFFNCKKLKSVVIASTASVEPMSLRPTAGTGTSSVTTIGQKAFQNCAALEDIGSLLDNLIIIDDYVFSGCKKLTNITLPNGLTRVGNHAFYNCFEIKELVIPNTVVVIDVYAFSYCTGLTSVTLPTGISTIAANSFSRCSSLLNITIPNNVTTIGNNAFNNCTSLVSATLSNTLTSIGSSAFANCPSLASITIPNSVTTLSASAFNNCTGLTELTMPGTITIPANAFTNVSNLTDLTLTGTGAMQTYTISTYNKTPWYYSRNNLTDVTISSGLTSIGDYTFRDCSEIEDLSIANTITGIGSYAFYGCTGIESLTIPGSVEDINEYAFYGCTGLTDLTLSEGIETLGVRALYNCTGLTELIIPDSMTSMDDYTLGGCTGLTELSVPAHTEYISTTYSGVTGLESIAITGTGAIADYTSSSYTSTPWYKSKDNINEVIIEDGVSGIGAYAFYQTTLTNITVPGSVESIGTSAFEGAALTSITLTNGIVSIGDTVFKSCTMSSITIPNSVTAMGSSVFSGWKISQTVNIDNTIGIVSTWGGYGWRNDCSAIVHYLRGLVD